MHREIAVRVDEWKTRLPEAERIEHLLVAAELGVSREELNLAYAYLMPLVAHHPKSAAHCLRVGGLAGRIARYLREEAALTFIGGTVHDGGKVGTPRRILDATTLTPDDHRRYIVPHVTLGYEIVRQALPEPAECLKHHHRFRRRNPYPEELPQPDEPYSVEREAYHKYLGSLIALADYVDAMRTRANDKFGEKSPSHKDRLRFLYEDHAHIKDELKRLIADGIVRV